MNVCNKWSVVTSFSQFIFDLLKVLRFLNTWRGNPNIFTARFNHADGLLNRANGVHRINRGHRLNANRIISTYRNIANVYLSCFPSTVFGQAVAILVQLCDLIVHTNLVSTSKVIDSGFSLLDSGSTIQVSSIKYQVSSIKNPESCFQHPASFFIQ